MSISLFTCKVCLSPWHPEPSEEVEFRLDGDPICRGCGEKYWDEYHQNIKLWRKAKTERRRKKSVPLTSTQREAKDYQRVNG